MASSLAKSSIPLPLSRTSTIPSSRFRMSTHVAPARRAFWRISVMRLVVVPVNMRLALVSSRGLIVA